LTTDCIDYPLNADVYALRPNENVSATGVLETFPFRGAKNTL